MELQLDRVLCVFDLETTGLSISTDRIIEMSVLKLFPDKSEKARTWLINPERPIPKESSDVHGITDDKVAHLPNFKSQSREIYSFIKGADLVGYNSNSFDVPLLAEEFLRVGIDFDFSKVRMVDLKNIFYKKEKRTLEAAYKFYCDKELKEAHSAEADTRATYEVFKGQLRHYPDLKNDIKWLSEFSSQKKCADLAGFITFNDKNEEVFSFGKYRGQLVERVLDKDKGYFSWIQNAEFPLYTKKVIMAIQLRKINAK